MTIKKLSSIALLLGLQLPLALPIQAAVESATTLTLKSAGQPVDTAVSADGHWLFVLTEQGKVEIYEADGTLKETIKIDGPADRISSSPTGEQLFLSDRETGAISLVAVNFIQNIDTVGAPFKGSEKASVVVTVFSDFQCPYCSKVTPLLDQILAQYPKDVKVVHKNFPLQSHQLALPAAIAALAAHRQGKFWEMHDKIFANYSALSETKFIEFAKELGLDMDKFAKDNADPQLRQQVQLDVQNGLKAEVRGTPTMFVNGRRLNARSFDGVKALIEAELRKIK